MKFMSLASGSSGNCFFIEGKNKKSILIDVGISAKRVCEIIGKNNRAPESIKGIFVTHEHADHIKGADVLSRHFNIPIFATKGTIEDSSLLFCDNVHKIKNNETTKLAGLEIEAFSKSHKASDPVSFQVRNNKTLSIITDFGKSCTNVCDSVNNSDFLVIESNHDLNMLENGPYPYFLKKWILSDIGHISNWHSSLCVLENAKPRLKNLMLAHLSEANNTPKLALKTFSSLLKERSDLHPRISLSLQDEASEIFSV